MFEPSKDFDPYRDLVELKNFAISTDTHLANLLKNEKEIRKYSTGYIQSSCAFN